MLTERLMIALTKKSLLVLLLVKKLRVQSCWRCGRNGKEQRGRCNPIHFQGEFLRDQKLHMSPIAACKERNKKG
jgi:hypothetical protein